MESGRRARFLECYRLSRFLPHRMTGGFMYGDSNEVGNYDSIWWSDDTDFEPTTPCSRNPKHPQPLLRPGSPLLKPVRGPVYDINWTSYSELLVTPAVLAAFEAAGLTGYEVHPVRFDPPNPKAKRPGKTPELYNIVVKGSGGLLDRRSCHLVWSICPVCGYIRHTDPKRGMWVRTDRWDGSDFFVVDEYTWVILVTRKVADLIIQNQWKVCTLIRSTEVSFKF